MQTHQPPDGSTTVHVNGVEFTHQEIQSVVDDFYGQVANDPLLSVPFQSVHDWPDHIQRLTHFWWTRFGGRPYMNVSYNPPLKHFHAGFNQEFLTRWLELFHATLAKHLKEPQSKLWALISSRMGEGLSMKNEMLKKHFEKA